MIETLRDHPDIRSVLQPVSPDSDPSPQQESKEKKRNDSFSPQLLLPPLPFDTRRHSDSSTVFSPESESDEPLFKSCRCQCCLNHACLTPHPMCTSCLLLYLSRSRTRKISSPTQCKCGGHSTSPTGLLPGASRHRGSFNDLSDLSELNKSLENITGHKHVPNPALLRVPSLMFEAGTSWTACSHGDEHEITTSRSGEQIPKPTTLRRASVCMGDCDFTCPVGWTSDVLYSLVKVGAMLLQKETLLLVLLEGFCILPTPSRLFPPPYLLHPGVCLHIIYYPESPNP